MAVSIAVNWTPPASSPLFDDDAVIAAGAGGSPNGQSSSEPQVTSTPLAPVSTNGQVSSASSPGRKAALLHPTASSSSSPPPSASSPQSAAAAFSRSLSPQPRSYAAAAASASVSSHSTSPTNSMQRQPSASSRQNEPVDSSLAAYPNGAPNPPQPAAMPNSGSTQQPQRGFRPPQAFQGPLQQQQQQQQYGAQQQNQQHPAYHHGAGFGPAYNMAFAPPTMPHQYAAWAQYQQMMASQQHNHQGQRHFSRQNDGAFGEVHQAHSSPTAQRPAALTYNDSFQQQAHPGVTYASASRGGLPPGAMAPTPISAVGPTPPPANSFHPYRRQGVRPADTTASAPSVAPPTSLPTASLAPPSSQRSRASSTDSRRDNAPAVSYSAAASNSMRSGVGPTSTPASSSGQAMVKTLSDSSQRTPSTTSRRPEAPSRTESTRSTSSGIATPPSINGTQTSTTDPSSVAHSRSASVSSQNSAFSSGLSDKASTVGRSTPVAGVGVASKKPSPLSRMPPAQTDQDHEDDDDTNADYGGSDREDDGINKEGRSTPVPLQKKKGFGGKLRKALSLSTMNELQQAEAAKPSRPSAAPSGRALPGQSVDTVPQIRSVSDRSSPPARSPGDFQPAGAGSSAASITSRRSTRPPISGSADGSGKRSLFNRKFNSSTDNISISSTVSSASVMLRKVGNLGKLARRHSLMGLTNMFNKDKDGAGKDGLHGDDFGALPVPADEAALASTGAGSKSKKVSKRGKSDPAAASVSHATVELDPNGDGNMTPAAHYVRQHQLQMQQQAEAEAEARAARQRQEAAEAAVASAAKKGKTTDDVVESRQKMIEKEKERLKSKRGWKNRLKVGGGGSISSIDSTQAPTGLETIPYEEGADSQGEYQVEAPRGVYPGPGYNSIRQGPPQIGEQNLGGMVGGFDADDLEPPRMPAAGLYGSEESGDEGETDSLRHWGEGIERSRASAARITNPKGILKKSASSSQLDQMTQGFSRPFAGRMRANSYDTPQGPGSGAPTLSSLSATTAGVDRMDGVPRLSVEVDQQQQGSGDGGQLPSSASRTNPSSSSPVYGHHSNSSLPSLSLMTNPTTGATDPRRGMQKRRICFTEMPIYHSTWPAHVYDRRGELATCNRLTQELAAQIKEELNSYKMEEMEVAPSSRIFTHFFV